jgi:hypothetical protein
VYARLTGVGELVDGEIAVTSACVAAVFVVALKGLLSCSKCHGRDAVEGTSSTTGLLVGSRTGAQPARAEGARRRRRRTKGRGWLLGARVRTPHRCG